MIASFIPFFLLLLISFLFLLAPLYFIFFFLTSSQHEEPLFYSLMEFPYEKYLVCIKLVKSEEFFFSSV